MKPDLQNHVERVASALRGRLGCMICDGAGERWAARNADDRFATASVIKVAVLLALAADVDAGRSRWDQAMPTALENTAGGSGVIQHLTPLPYTLRDLATLMIIVSDNRATNAIIDLVGIDRINAYLLHAGWENTVLARRMMDLEARARGRDNFSTPHDTAEQLRRLLAGELATPATTSLLLDMLRAQTERDRLPAWLAPDVAVAHKTGTLPGVFNDAGILFLPTGPVIAAVFTNDLAVNAEGRVAIQEIGRAIVEASR
ncbi:MAG TPA: serine hydrolase [bacterium]|nr:serine hydrolase [bacterium]